MDFEREDLGSSSNILNVQGQGNKYGAGNSGS